MQIIDHTFLVTGGSSGLGAACVETFVAAGGKAVIADVNAEVGQALADRLGDAVTFVHTDVTDEASIQNAIDTALDTYGGLNGAVNCAGVGAARKILSSRGDHDVELFTRVIRINLIGTFSTIKLAGRAISTMEPGEDGERGVIINTASVAAFDGQFGQAAYSASKGGVVGLTLPAARELSQFGIRVVTIAPGTFDTPMMAGASDEVRASLAEQVPFPKRMGDPMEYAALAKHIIENRMLNGEVIRLDGAIRMGPR